MSRDWRLYWDDIIDASSRVRRYTAGMTRADLEADQRTLGAVARNLEGIGEAVKNLPPDVRAQCPDVEWRKIAGFRDVVAHAYFGLDMAIVWSVSEIKVPQLLASMQRIRFDRDTG